MSAIMTNMLIGFIAMQHIGFLILEMFLWDKPSGRRIFGHTREAAITTKVLAMNQGLYNGFLAAGLVWGLALGATGNPIKIFFLACVIAAGVFGGFTASRKILYVQAMPAIAALVLVLLS